MATTFWILLCVGASFITSALIVAASMLSARISHAQNIPETYDPSYEQPLNLNEHPLTVE